MDNPVLRVFGVLMYLHGRIQKVPSGGGGTDNLCLFFVFFCCFRVFLLLFLIGINVINRGLYEPFSRGFVRVFLRKPKATCDFPVGGPNPLPPPPSGSAHVCICFKLISELIAYHKSCAIYVS